MVVNNSGGEKSLKYGKTEKYVESFKVVLRDGNEYSFKKLDRKELDQKMRQGDLEGDIYRKVSKLVDDNYDLIKGAKPDVSKYSAGYSLWNIRDRENQTFNLDKLS